MDQQPDSFAKSLGMQHLFRRDEQGRGAYLSRLFAFFSEEVIRHWAACEQAPYGDLGRPVVWDEESPRYQDEARSYVEPTVIHRPVEDVIDLVADERNEPRFNPDGEAARPSLADRPHHRLRANNSANERSTTRRTERHQTANSTCCDSRALPHTLSTLACGSGCLWLL
ncbi:MAG: hypothetical protein ACRDIZ_02225 [Actinomycetota bacterium]